MVGVAVTIVKKSLCWLFIVLDLGSETLTSLPYGDPKLNLSLNSLADRRHPLVSHNIFVAGGTIFVAVHTIFVAGDSNFVAKGGACARNIQSIRSLPRYRPPTPVLVAIEVRGTTLQKLIWPSFA